MYVNKYVRVCMWECGGGLCVCGCVSVYMSVSDCVCVCVYM